MQAAKTTRVKSAGFSSGPTVPRVQPCAYDDDDDESRRGVTG